MKLIEELYHSDLSATARPASCREECRDIDRLKNRCTGKLLAVRLMSEAFADDT